MTIRHKFDEVVKWLKNSLSDRFGATREMSDYPVPPDAIHRCAFCDRLTRQGPSLVPLPDGRERTYPAHCRRSACLDALEHFMESAS